MLQVDVASNLEDVIGNLTDLEATQVPFAWVVAINRTASAGQAAVREELPDRFTIRRDWTAKGIRTKLATKSSPMALVFTKDWYMEHQEGGAERTSSRGGAMYIPSLEVREGKDFRGLVVKGLRPRTLLAAAARADKRKKRRYRKGDAAYATPLAFIATTATGKRGLFIRKDHNRLPITLLYTLQDTVKIPPKWGFERTTTGVADKTLRREFIKALDQALKSAKGGPIKSNYVSHLAEHGGASDWYGGGGGGNALGGGVLSSLER